MNITLLNTRKVIYCNYAINHIIRTNLFKLANQYHTGQICAQVVNSFRRRSYTSSESQKFGIDHTFTSTMHARS